MSRQLGTFTPPKLSSTEYDTIRKFIYKESGIDLGASKQMLVSSRLNKRLRYHKITNFSDYISLFQSNEHKLEKQMATDLLTTNETYFFREPEHFKFLKKDIIEVHEKGTPFSVWSAASSSGEEAYSVSMVLDDYFGTDTPWKVFGSDISTRIIEKARQALYPLIRIDGIPKPFLKKYCQKGKGEYDGFLKVKPSLIEKVKFDHINLIKPLPNVGKFDVIFLRNVLIYFDEETKLSILKKLISALKPKGILFIGHSESLKDMDLNVSLVATTTYQKN